MSARLGPEWRAFVEAVRDDAAARRDLANTDTAVGATEVYAANDLVRAADALLAAEGSRDMRESAPVAPGGAGNSTNDGGLASPAHVPASPAPADPAGEGLCPLNARCLVCQRSIYGSVPDTTCAARDGCALRQYHAEVQRREAAARGEVVGTGVLKKFHPSYPGTVDSVRALNISTTDIDGIPVALVRRPRDD